MSEDPPAPSDPFDPLSSSQPALLVEAGSPRLRARYGDLRVPHLRLGTWPAPVQRLETLSEELGTEVWLKSEGRAGRLYGGNKVRKLEYLLADAVARGSQRVVTIGAYGSHHALATATYGRALGLEVDLVLYPQPVTAHVVDDLLASSATGATLLPSRNAVFAWLRAGWRALTQPRTVSIPAGGSSPLGALGWVEAGLELAAQVEAGELPAPEWVFVPAGTCGTVSGLALGLELAGLEGC